MEKNFTKVLLLSILLIISGFSCKSDGGGESLNLPVISFTANPSTIYYGDSTTLSWNVSNATSVIISPILGSVASSGSQEIVNFTANIVFTLTATNSDGTANRNLTVTVLPGPVLYEVLSQGWRFGYPTVFGTVGNIGNGPAYNLSVQCYAFDSNSILLDTTFPYYTNPTTLAPGGIATFEAPFLFLSGWKKVATVRTVYAFLYGTSNITQIFLHDLKTGKVIEQETVIK